MPTVLQVSQPTRRSKASGYLDHDSEGAWERSADEFAFQLDEGDDDGKWDDDPDWEDDDWEWEGDDEEDEDEEDDEDDDR
jgi:hypothetical protein